MSRRTRRLVGASLLLALSCQSVEQPEDPVWGKQSCGSCAMLVSDRHFAGQAITARGERLFFDDPGCLATYVSQHDGVQHAWLMSARGQWIDAEKAHFEAGAKSPMDYGFQVTEAGTLDLRTVVTIAKARHTEDAKQ
jgi:hypothetical protein